MVREGIEGIIFIPILTLVLATICHLRLVSSLLICESVSEILSGEADSSTRTCSGHKRLG